MKEEIEGRTAGVLFGEEMADTPRADDATVACEVAHCHEERAGCVGCGRENNARRKKPLYSLEAFVERERTNRKLVPREVALSFITFGLHVLDVDVPDWMRAEGTRVNIKHAIENPFYQSCFSRAVVKDLLGDIIYKVGRGADDRDVNIHKDTKLGSNRDIELAANLLLSAPMCASCYQDWGVLTKTSARARAKAASAYQRWRARRRSESRIDTGAFGCGRIKAAANHCYLCVNGVAVASTETRLSRATRLCAISSTDWAQFTTLFANTTSLGANIPTFTSVLAFQCQNIHLPCRFLIR